MTNMPQFIKVPMLGIKWTNNNIRGFTIIEIIVVIAVIITAFSTIFGFFVFESKVSERGRLRLQAVSLTEEGIEAVRNFRDNTIWASNGLGTLTIGADYHPATSSFGWNMISGSETINGFSRKIDFSRVYRDANDNISSSGTEDTNTRKVVILVSWTDRLGVGSENITTYITNWRE